METLIYKNVMETARNVSKYLNDSHKIFTPRPWNRFSPENSLWWVVPSTYWPAYQYGKYVFFYEDGFLYCGLNIEKGLGRIVANYYPKTEKKGLIMKDEWTWNKFLDVLNKDKINKTLSELQEINNQPVTILLRGGLADDPDDFDPQAHKSDLIWFELEGENLKLIKNEMRNSTLLHFLNASSMKDISDTISKINSKELDCTWIDLNILVKFKINEIYSCRNSNLIDVEQLNALVLEQLKYWVY